MVIFVVDYVTISVPRKVKEILEKVKGKDSWGDFLLKLYGEYMRLKRAKAFNELKSTLSTEELENIEKSMREFREKFRLR